MRNFILLIFVATSFPAIGQKWLMVDDSLDINERILKLDLPKEEIDLRLKKFYKQRSEGTLIMLGGTALSTASMIIYYRHDNDNTRDDDGNKTDYSGIAIGGVMMVVGGVIRVDAYKHLRQKRRK